MAPAIDPHAQTCKGCVHLFLTYDPRMPYGCRAMGFKSRRYPYHEVQTLTQMPCQMRRARGAGERV